jgi:hypothetical protein
VKFEDEKNSSEFFVDPRGSSEPRGEEEFHAVKFEDVRTPVQILDTEV